MGNTRCMVGEGDSNLIGLGTITPGTNDVMTQLFALSGYNTNFDWVTNGVAGKTSTQSLANFNTECGVAVAFAALTCNKVICLIEQAGANDLHNGTSKDIVIANLIALVLAARVAGATAVIVCTCFPSSGFFTSPQDEARIQMNAAINGGITKADAICNGANNPLLTDPTNLTYYQNDFLHLNPTGAGVFAAQLQTVINPYI